jgi:hypothetical protein
MLTERRRPRGQPNPRQSVDHFFSCGKRCKRRGKDERGEDFRTQRSFAASGTLHLRVIHWGAGPPLRGSTTQVAGQVLVSSPILNVHSSVLNTTDVSDYHLLSNSSSPSHSALVSRQGRRNHPQAKQQLILPPLHFSCGWLLLSFAPGLPPISLPQ